MITIKIDGIQSVQEMLKQYPVQASRALETAIDKTAREIKDAIKQALPQVFDRPNPYTMNSLRIQPTKNHNMQASVLFKEPGRMTNHYLVPQVLGMNPTRRLKGFEWVLGGKPYIPGRNAQLDQYGNISNGKIRQILSVLGKAEHIAGYAANMTARSQGRNKKPRDYVWLPNGRGKLPPGIYERFTIGNGVLMDKKARRVNVKNGKGHAIWEQGRGGVVRARGLRAVLVVGRAGRVRQQRLPFYEIGQKVSDALLEKLFTLELAKRMGR